MSSEPARDDAYGVDAAIALTIDRFLLRHMIRMYREFDGDLIECIVLGQVAHHNLAGVLGESTDVHELVDRLGTRGRPAQEELFPTNAHSIALATGIPRETVRRKIAALVKRGWLEQDERANLTFTAVPFAHFRESREESVRDLLQVARALARVRGQNGSSASRDAGSSSAGPRPAPEVRR